MFTEEDLKPDTRPVMAVCAPCHGFLLKYLDREFDRRITDVPEDAARGSTAVILTGVENVDNGQIDEFRNKCASKGLPVITLRLPQFVLGTGMNGELMRVARGVSRGTMLLIKDNKAVWSVIHATDVARAAKAVADARVNSADFVVSAEPVAVNDLIAALGRRIKDKRVGSISPRWARALYGGQLYDLLTKDYTVGTAAFCSAFPEFRFVNPAEYLTTHVYDNESL